MAQMYRNTENGRVVELIEINEKASNVTVKTNDGLYKSYGLKSFKKHWKLIVEDNAEAEAEKTVDDVKKNEPEKQEEKPEKKAEKPAKKNEKKAKNANTEAVDTVALVASILDELGIEHKDVDKGLSVANNINKRVFEVWKRKTRIRINLNPDMLDFDNFKKDLADTIGPSTNPNSKLTITMYVDLEFIPDAIKNICSLIYDFEIEGEEVENEEA